MTTTTTSSTSSHSVEQKGSSSHDLSLIATVEEDEVSSDDDEKDKKKTLIDGKLKCVVCKMRSLPEEIGMITHLTGTPPFCNIHPQCFKQHYTVEKKREEKRPFACPLHPWVAIASWKFGTKFHAFNTPDHPMKHKCERCGIFVPCEVTRTKDRSNITCDWKRECKKCSTKINDIWRPYTVEAQNFDIPNFDADSTTEPLDEELIDNDYVEPPLPFEQIDIDDANSESDN